MDEQTKIQQIETELWRIDEIIKLRLADLVWLIEVRASLEDPQAIANSQREFEERRYQLIAELRNCIKSIYEKLDRARNPKSNS